jgi:hypothetical protein
MSSSYVTPYEAGSSNQTARYEECITFYQRLAHDFPETLQFQPIGLSNAGYTIYAGIVMNHSHPQQTRQILVPNFMNADDMRALRTSGRPIFFNNNGIHPGEPEGIDTCMAIVRDFCTLPEALASLENTIYAFIPVYNVDGCMNRNNTSRVNQNGPESFGFRANALNLDQNRDFVKCDSTSSQVFNQFFSLLDPEVMVDTHCSNGADYQYTMTLIHTQPDKLGGPLGAFLKNDMIPKIYEDMDARGWPTCPYVNTVTAIPDDGIEDFIDSPRYSTGIKILRSYIIDVGVISFAVVGYTALRHCIGFMPETHMLKPYKDRYDSMVALIHVVLQFTVANASNIRALRAQTRLLLKEMVSRSSGNEASGAGIPLSWMIDSGMKVPFAFCGYEAVYEQSLLGNYKRLRYDRTKPFTKDVAYFNTAVPDAVLEEQNIPLAYVVPQAYTQSVVQRLQWNGVRLHRLSADLPLDDRASQRKLAQCYRINSVDTRSCYEGHAYHTAVAVSRCPVFNNDNCIAHAGDWLVLLSEQEDPRYVLETLEPQATDSLFRWGFFNAHLEKKEDFSDYVFEDEALLMLKTEPGLQQKFDDWKSSHPELVASQEAVLRFLFENGSAHHEAEYLRYPIFSLFDLSSPVLQYA